MKTSGVGVAAGGMSRRVFLRCAGALGAAGVTGLWPRRGAARSFRVDGGFIQQVNEVRLYMTHYALFEEPDPVIPARIYIDAATGAPTDEFTLLPPCETIAF